PVADRCDLRRPVVSTVSPGRRHLFMRLAFSRRRGWRPRHARPSWIARTPLSPRWLVASLVVFSLTGVAAQLSPHPEESAAQHTAAAAPASVTSYFAPRRTTPPPASRIPAARPLTHAVDVRAAALPSVPEPSPPPARRPAALPRSRRVARPREAGRRPARRRRAVRPRPLAPPVRRAAPPPLLSRRAGAVRRLLHRAVVRLRRKGRLLSAGAVTP